MTGSSCLSRDLDEMCVDALKAHCPQSLESKLESEPSSTRLPASAEVAASHSNIRFRPARYVRNHLRFPRTSRGAGWSYSSRARCTLNRPKSTPRASSLQQLGQSEALGSTYETALYPRGTELVGWHRSC